VVNAVISRAKGALVGLAIGDALGSPTEGKRRVEIERQWGRINDFLSDEQVGTDDTEYALLTSLLLLKHGIHFTQEDVVRLYQDNVLDASNKHKGAGFSEMLYLQNLRNGLGVPLSGKHIHGWSDGMAMRSAPYGIVAAGDPVLASLLAQREGEVSFSGEGVYCAMAVAAAVSAAVGGAGWEAAQKDALKAVPEDSWTYRAIRSGLEIGHDVDEVWQALEPLEASLVRDYYHWSDIAPEPVGIAFGLLNASKGSFVDTVLGGVNIGRDADTISAIGGAIAGALNGYESLPQGWRKRIISARGNCIRVVAGMNIAETAEAVLKVNDRDRKNLA